jgi:hypothetical protein
MDVIRELGPLLLPLGFLLRTDFFSSNANVVGTSANPSVVKKIFWDEVSLTC